MDAEPLSPGNAQSTVMHYDDDDHNDHDDNDNKFLASQWGLKSFDVEWHVAGDIAVMNK